MDLGRLLRPRSIAVIGGGTWCENVIKSCHKMGFAGDVYAVHPQRPELAGVPCVSDVSNLPTPPDACFIGVNRTLTLEIVAALRKMGAGGAVCFASGFAEAIAEDGQSGDLQSALLEAAGEMPLIGPNCYGFINYLDRALLWPDEHGGIARDTGVAVITQSSNVAINITMQHRGLPIAFMVTAGNQAQVGISDIGAELLRDDRISALGLHIEGIDDLEKFQDLALLSEEMGKPIVALKVGKSEQAQRATISHTASLAGSDIGAAALLSYLGIAQTGSLEEMIEALKIAHVTGKLPRKAIASLSCSGGEASLMADISLTNGIALPDPDEQQCTALREVLGPLVAIANPLDYHTYIWGKTDAMTAVFTTMWCDRVSMVLIVVDFPREDRCDPSAWMPVVDCVIAAQKVSDGQFALLSSLAENMPEIVSQRLIDHGVLPLHGMDAALGAISAISGLDPCGKAKVAAGHLPKQSRTLSETRSKAELAAYGVPIPHALGGNRDDVLALSEQVGYPLVVKAEGMAHKTEEGGVALNLRSDLEVKRALQEMQAARFLVEEMISDPGAELLVGVCLDPAHGYVMTLGWGGTLTEVINDTISFMLPTDGTKVIAALETLKIGKILDGYRGAPAADRTKIVDAILAVQAYVMDNLGRVEEVEINPLICTPHRAVAVDALIKIGERFDG